MKIFKILFLISFTALSLESSAKPNLLSTEVSKTGQLEDQTSQTQNDSTCKTCPEFKLKGISCSEESNICSDSIRCNCLLETPGESKEFQEETKMKLGNSLVRPLNNTIRNSYELFKILGSDSFDGRVDSEQNYCSLQSINKMLGKKMASSNPNFKCSIEDINRNSKEYFGDILPGTEINDFRDFKTALAEMFKGAVSFDGNGADVSTPINHGKIPVNIENPQCLSSRGKEKLNLSNSLNRSIQQALLSDKDLNTVIPEMIEKGYVPHFSIEFYKNLKSKMNQRFPNFNIKDSSSNSRDYFAELDKNIAELASSEEMKNIRDSFQSKCSKFFSHITNLLCQKEGSHIAITSEKYHKVDFNPKEESDDDLLDELSEGDDDENHKRLISYCREREDAIFIASDTRVIGSDSSPCQTFSQDMPLMSISERNKAMEITTPHILFNQEELSCLSQSLNETEKTLVETDSKKDKDAAKLVRFEENLCLHLSCQNYALAGGPEKLVGGKCDPRESPELYSAIQELQQFNCSKEPERVDEMCNKGEMTLAFQNILELYLEQCLEGGEECIREDNIDTILGKDTDLRKYYDSNIDRVRTSYKSRKNVTGNDFSSDWAVNEFLKTDLQAAQKIENLRGFDKDEEVKSIPEKDESVSSSSYASSSTSQNQIASNAPTIEEQVIMDNSAPSNDQLKKEIEREKSSIVARVNEMNRQQSLLGELTRSIIKANSIKVSNGNKRNTTKDDYFKAKMLDNRIKALSEELKNTPKDDTVDAAIADAGQIQGTFIPAPEPRKSVAGSNRPTNNQRPGFRSTDLNSGIVNTSQSTQGSTNSLSGNEDSVSDSTDESKNDDKSGSINISEGSIATGGSGSSASSRAPASIAALSGGSAGSSGAKLDENDYLNLPNIESPEIKISNDLSLDEKVEEYFKDSIHPMGHPLKVTHQSFSENEYLELMPKFSDDGVFSHYVIIGPKMIYEKTIIEDRNLFVRSKVSELKYLLKSN
ncbi:MAG: hypothetical protein ACPGJV_13550 [Bacteriovoracaceae bacterium]